MLKVEHISSGYGKKQVLFDVSFEVKQGEIVLLIGSNGSGKSTLLKAIYGLLPLWKNPETNSCGFVKFVSEDITGIKPSGLIHKGLLYIPQKNSCFDDLTVKENLDISSLSLKDGKLYRDRYEKTLQLFPVLKDMLAQKPMKLSGGERQLLTLAMAALHEPKMILMDEPFAGLSPQNITFVRENLEALNKKEGITFLIVEHRVRESYNIAQKIIALKHGFIFSDNLVPSDYNLSDLSDVFV